MQAGRVLIIGYGNDLRGDDGVGQEVARALFSAGTGLALPVPARVIWSVQLLPEMALDLSKSSFAVFVDAAYDANPPGSVNVYDLGGAAVGDQRAARPALAAAQAAASSCWLDLSPAGLCSLAHELYGASPPAALVTVSVSCASTGIGSTGIGSTGVGSTAEGPGGAGLSPAVRAAVDVAVDAVKGAVASWRRAGALGRERGEVAHA